MTAGERVQKARPTAAADAAGRRRGGGSFLSLQRLLACTIRETLELVRDPIRAGFAVVWPQFLIVALIGGLFLALALLRFRNISAASA